jgi:hypothetical protein
MQSVNNFSNCASKNNQEAYLFLNSGNILHEVINMGATSVTGVGPGAADNLKGPMNNRSYWVPQVNPHVVIAGNVDLSAGAATITFPNALNGGGANYVVAVHAESSNTTYVSAKTDDGDGNFESFDITGTGTDTVNWMVVKAGAGLEA